MLPLIEINMVYDFITSTICPQMQVVPGDCLYPHGRLSNVSVGSQPPLSIYLYHKPYKVVPPSFKLVSEPHEYYSYKYNKP